jgi:hypothetical protein
MTAAANIPSNSALAQFSTANPFIDQANLSGNQPGTTPGADFISDPNSVAYVADGSAFGTAGKFGGHSPFSTYGSIDAPLNFYELTKNGTSGLAKAAVTPFTQPLNGGSYMFTLLSNGTLNYATAAVPEADTYAMMLAGLGLVGLVVRRRAA